MKITFDASKREKNRAEKGLDFERAAEVFEGVTVTRSDERKAYGEPRFVTSGRLDGRSRLDTSRPGAEDYQYEESK